MADEIFDPRPGEPGYAGPLAVPEPLPADILADDQEYQSDKAISKLDDVGPPDPGEGDDLPNPEIGMEC